MNNLEDLNHCYNHIISRHYKSLVKNNRDGCRKSAEMVETVFE